MSPAPDKGTTHRKDTVILNICTQNQCAQFHKGNAIRSETKDGINNHYGKTFTTLLSQRKGLPWGWGLRRETLE